MKWHTAGTNLLVNYPLKLSGEFIIPDTGSLRLTVRGHTGVPLVGYENAVLTDSGLTSVIVAIPALQNTLGSGADLENRYVTISGTLNSAPFSFYFHYRITAFLPLSVSGETVRSLIGANEEELPDEDIDLYEAYFALLASTGSTFSDAFVATNQANIHANNSVALQAAITVIPSLQLRVMTSETTHQESYVRAKVDFLDLRESLRHKLQEEMTKMAEVISGVASTTLNPTVFLLTSPTDVITGT